MRCLLEVEGPVCFKTNVRIVSHGPHLSQFPTAGLVHSGVALRVGQKGVHLFVPKSSGEAS